MADSSLLRSWAASLSLRQIILGSTVALDMLKENQTARQQRCMRAGKDRGGVRPGERAGSAQGRAAGAAGPIAGAPRAAD